MAVEALQDKPDSSLWKLPVLHVLWKRSAFAIEPGKLQDYSDYMATWRII